MAYEIRIHELAATELDELRAFDHRTVLNAIDEQLRHQPTVSTRNRKSLANLAPSFEHVPPVWELRVEVFRVFYDVDEDSREVHIRAVRRKLTTQTTKDIT